MTSLSSHKQVDGCNISEVGRWFSLSVEFLEFFPTCLGEGVPLGTVPGGMCVFVLQALVSMWEGRCAWLIFIDGKTSPLLTFSTAIDPLPAWLIFYKGIRSQLVSEFHFEFHVCVTFPLRTPTRLHASSVPHSWNIHLQSIYMFPLHSSQSKEYICIPKTKDVPAGKRRVC